MRVRLGVATCAVLLTAWGTGLAQDVPDRPPILFRIYGFGTRSCAQWIAARKPDGNVTLRHADIAWLLGYLTGIARYAWMRGVPLGATNADAVETWVDQYCAAHPRENLEEAGFRLTAELIGRGARESIK